MRERKPTYLLALDTATSGLALALFDGAEWRAVACWRTPDRHTAELMARCQELLRAAGLGPEDLAAIAVVSGPGSFTGLRAGVAAAKGLALALELPLFGIGTEEAILAELPAALSPLHLVIPAGRGRLALHRYRWEAGWMPEGEPVLTTASALAEAWTPGTWLVGEWTARDQAVLERHPIAAWCIPWEIPSRVMGAARRAWARYQAGERPDPALLRPTYLRTPSVPEG
ncbi:tRNA (adenosine(37)-N6)-threonylcarbamoyltransferase complex dimerization subunit type 1 TsaB [Thermoflexus hugenholtzii]|jgi:Inactive homolog of metal-dependent proteases, putative molecular chaperone|uniref:tRNA threonylcarbamoyladenosine biosynthesis protein TsaB n=1 Tax=Thermoflexus hugenholtzii JAD2 TaxID=877466 RepID=A0A212QUQ0_9CHLR|nr:tRNA (adenosine(37)-N6)-threonylcarbamoyltransferase complex dimerization subunit type 1 TsaB [Thermoflexus hugenholtzii]SNB63417.1 tRNA threonylcarbamoyladenosine biosynthesis protein TsaB [Thermoflexus hugenholtzii JAD2]